MGLRAFLGLANVAFGDAGVGSFECEGQPVFRRPSRLGYFRLQSSSLTQVLEVTKLVSMYARKNDRRALSGTIWFLIGALFLGCMVQSLPSVKEIAVCVEEKAFEFDGEDDDRSGVRCLDYVLIVRSGHFLQPQSCQRYSDIHFVLASQDRWRSHSERAPPLC
jgi:hypothetical protein